MLWEIVQKEIRIIIAIPGNQIIPEVCWHLTQWGYRKGDIVLVTGINTFMIYESIIPQEGRDFEEH